MHKLIVYLVEDQPILADVLKRIIINISPDCVVKVFPSIAALCLDDCGKNSVDVVLAGVNFYRQFDWNGFPEIRNKFPLSKVIALISGDPLVEINFNAMHSCDLFISMRWGGNRIHLEIMKFFLDHGLIAENVPVPPFLRIPKRKKQLLVLLSQGLTIQDISKVLGIGVGTVKVHLFHLYKFLGVSGRLAAIRYAFENGIL